MDVAVTRTGFLAAYHDLAPYISIYHNFKYQYSLNVPWRPKTVAAPSEGKFIISDGIRSKVMSPEGKYEMSWPETSILGDKITTTPDGMIVTGRNFGLVFEGVIIRVHQPNGELIRTHQITDYNLIGEIASKGKQIAFATTYLLYHHKVCVIDFVTGQTLWTLNVGISFGICYEQKSNTLLIALHPLHLQRRVIYQYCNSTGRLISRLASGLKNPSAMTTTHDNKLVVADQNTIKVYQIELK